MAIAVSGDGSCHAGRYAGFQLGPLPMSIEKSAAIILRVVEFSNTSCVLTLYTRDFGKISALAKGARRRKSPFEGALDVLSICHVVFVHKSTDALDLLTEAKLERRFRAASTDLNRLYAAYYFVELVTALTDAADPQPELFDLLQSAIVGLDEGESWEAWLLRFEMRLLTLIGHGPAFDLCVSCGKALAPGTTSWFSSLAGGLVCSACRPGKRGVVNVRSDVIRALRTAADPLGDWKQVVTRESAGPIRGLMTHYISHVLGYRPKLHPFLTTEKHN